MIGTAVELLGDREPRLSVVPDGDTTRGDTAVDFAKWCGLTLYPWQEDLLRDLCRTIPDGRWAAREAVVSIARQNGKGEVLLARELAGIYLFGERLVYHTAHLMETALDAQKRMWEVIESNEGLLYWWGDDPDEMPTLVTSNGRESIQFPAVHASVAFRTRTPKTGRGLAIDLLIFDECFHLPREVFAAMNSTTKSRRMAQKIFISSPVNRHEHAHGRIFSAKRWSALDGAARMLLKEWSPAPGADPFADATWRAANPSLVMDGPGVQYDEIQAEADAARVSEDMLAVFLVESLGAGIWFPRDGDDDDDFDPIVPDEKVDAAFTTAPGRLSDVVLAIDGSADRSTVSIAAAGRVESGLRGLVGYHGRMNVDAAVTAVLQAIDDADPVAVIVDPKSAAEPIIDPLERAGIEVHRMSYADVKSATALLLSGMDEGRIALSEDERLRDAFRCAALREDREGGVALARRSGTICQLVAVSFALWGVDRFGALPRVNVGTAVPLRSVKSGAGREFAF